MNELEIITLEHIQDLLKNYEFKKLLIEELNKKIDLPFFNETTEENIYTAVYECILNCLDN